MVEPVQCGAMERTWLLALRNMLTINWRMLPSKLGFIFYGGILGLHIPALTPFLVSVGLSKTEAGYITGLKYISSMLAGPIWGMLTDYTGHRKLIMSVIFLGCAFPVSAMPWIASAIHPQTGNATSCAHLIADKAKYEDCTDEVETLFWSLLAIMVFANTFLGAMPGYVDSIIIQIVKEDPKRPSYGAQRNFGSIGFAVFVQLGGLVADAFHIEGLSMYTATFLLYLPCCLIMIPLGAYIVGQAKFEPEEGDGNTAAESSQTGTASAPTRMTWENSITRKVLFMFKSFDFSFFMMTVFIGGIANNVFLNYSIVLAQDTIPGLKSDKTRQALIMATGCLSEILIFPFSLKIIQKIGTSFSIIIGIFSFVLRFLAMAFFQKFWIVVLVQILHGLGFALSWAAMMEHTHKVAPKEIAITVFGYLSGIYFSVAPIVSGVAGGRFYDVFGGPLLFECVAGLNGVWGILMVIYYGGKYLKRRRIRKMEAQSVRYRKSVNETEAKEVDVVAAYDTGIVNPLGVLDDETAEERLETLEEPF